MKIETILIEKESGETNISALHGRIRWFWIRFSGLSNARNEINAKKK